MWKRRSWLERLANALGHSGDAHPTVSVSDLDRFTEDIARRYSRSTTHGAVAVLRCYLGYRYLTGVDARDRSRSLDYPLVYRHMKLPLHLQDGELDHVLATIDRTTSYGKRDWAVWMLLVAYSLRAGEVARLRMDELDFSRRNLKVRRLKGGGAQLLPMTEAVEDALEAYLLGGRPDRPAVMEVFLVHQAPIRPFRSGGSLSHSCVRRYLEQVTLRRDLPSIGSHVLRHTTARRLLEGGTPLPVLQEILAHQDPQTTKGYLRLSIEQLREVGNGYAELL
jgi:site-specific recombinase XerD